jgi:DinB superfamily
MHSYLQRVQQAIEDAVRGLSLEQLAWHREGKWSAAAILEHLSLTYSGTAKGLQRGLDAGRPNITPPSAAQRAARFVVTGLRFMPPGRKAPAMVMPKGAPPETVLADVRRNLAAADDAISRCEARLAPGPGLPTIPSSAR